VITFEWLVPPVVEKVLAIEAYVIPDEVEYLQVDGSSVAKDMVAWVVPAAKVPVGRPEDLVGAVVSETTTAKVFPEATLDKIETFPASSVVLIAK
jgi:hypothetical protein